MWTAWAASLWWGVPVGLAQPAAVGLFVGSNRAGPGQEPLQFAVDDALRFRQVMAELGGLDDGVLLDNPDADELRAALEERSEVLRSREEQGERTVFVFYYSGHARSRTLTLGRSELPLEELRAELDAMPSTVTVAVLDACQSGAISGVKGVQPGRSFSYNSMDTLRAEGLAVMASSTGSELSQESEGIGGSFFTHHLVTGLRGAADEDRSGTVSVDEAYRYAYRETLVHTAPTQVGSQHATLETKLRGQGDMVLTRPVAGTAWVVFDGPPGRILVVRADNGAVVAEVVQEAGAEVTVALGAGDYRLVGSDEAGSYVCDLTLREGERASVSSAACTREETPSVQMTVKSPRDRRRAYRAEALGVELGGGALLSPPAGAFVERLDAFGFDARKTGSLDAPVSAIGGVAVTGRLAGRFSWGVAWSTLEHDRFVRPWQHPDEPSAGSDAYGWRTSRLGLYPRYTAPLRADTVLLSVQGGGGLTFGTETLETSRGSTTTRLSPRPHVAGGLALHVVVARGRSVRVGPYLQVEGVWAPGMVNQLDEQRNVGGLGASLGLRVTP